MTTLSEYEKQRLKNMAANKAHLVALGLDKATAAMKVIKKAPIKGAAINKKKKDVVPPRTKSLRQQNCAPDGSQLPDKPEIKPPEPVEMRPARKPSVPLEAAKVSTGATLADDASAFLQRVRGTLARKEKKRGEEHPDGLDRRCLVPTGTCGFTTRARCGMGKHSMRSSCPSQSPILT